MNNLRCFFNKLEFKYLNILLGAFLLIIGIIALFIAPNVFFDLSYSGRGLPSSFISSILIGWTLLFYGITNKIKFKNEIKILNHLPFKNKLGLKNALFFFFNLILIAIISTTFLIKRPDILIKERNEQFQKDINDINKTYEELIKKHKKPPIFPN